MTDPALVRRARAGDELAFQTLARRYRVVYRGFAKDQYYLGGGGDRSDLWQEGLIGLHKAVQGWNPSKGTFATFAHLCIERQIVTAVATSTRRKHEVLNKAVPFSTPRPGKGEDEELTMGDLIPTPGDGPDAELEAKEDLEQIVWICRERLTKAEHQAVVGFAEGRSYKEIEARTGLTFKQIDNARQRAKQKFTQLLEVAA